MTIRRSIQPLPAIARRVRPVLTADHLRSVVDAYLEMDEFVFDVETRGEYPLDPCRNDVFWVALGGHGRSDVIPMGHSRGEVRVPSHKRRYRTLNPKRLHERKRDGGRYVLTKERTVATTYWPPPPQLRPDEVFDTLEPLFFSKRRKVGHNVKFDLRSVAKYYDGQVPPPPYGETTIAQHLLNENLHAYTLNALIKEHFGSAYPQQGKNPDEAAFTDLALYAGRDARYTWLLWKELTRLLEEQGLLSLLDLEMDVLSTLVDMEQEGVVIDTESLTALGGKLTAAMEDMQAQVWARSGYEWNLDSNADKAWFVYDVCEHKPRNLTATGQRSTTRADLMVYGRRDVDVARVVNFGYYRKMYSTYVEGLRSQLVEGRIHTNVNQHRTVTGRLSSNSPNLQNIPRAGLVTDAVEDGDLVQFGAMIRSMFLAPEGEMLVVADYDQIELRVLAHETQDPTLLRTFREGLDPHAMTAASILGKDIADVTSAERQALGKTINFAVVYGASAQRVAEQAGVKVKEAQQFLDGYWDAYPAILRWKDKMIRECERRRPQEVYTFLGRHRRVGREILSDDFKHRSRAQRQVINSIIQGSAADIIKLAMIDLSREFKGTRFSMVLSVHDELVATAPEEEAEECASIMGKVMSGVLDDYEFSVPLTVSPGFARRWSEAK